MASDPLPLPRLYPGVMVSSTFTDLKEHRARMIGAIKSHGLTDVSMENDAAKPEVDVVASSLRMVAESTAYVAILGHKYGQTPVCPDRNPGGLSITELEYNEALRLERPVLLFLMGDDHPVKLADVEPDPDKRTKLDAFKKRAKQMRPGSTVHRVYSTFQSLDEFDRQANQAIAGLRQFLGSLAAPPVLPDVEEPSTRARGGRIPLPPVPYHEPPYTGSHDFQGRRAELELLSDWASPASPQPVLLFEAIGGMGKSMLTWHWTRTLAPARQPAWAGVFWYSFYERGAIMADFCRHALAYMTSRPLEDFKDRRTPDMQEELMLLLTDRPWLLILDGLERVLVAYHRSDAASLPDEAADTPTDAISRRDPCAAIRPEDDDLLRAFAAAAPSRILISTRLVPRVLLNQASQPIPGVRRELLAGLRPPDAELLLRSCGCSGDSAAIQRYLQTHFDCHPLTTSVIAGLVASYAPDPGNFDLWEKDSTLGGASLNLANLDLIQKRKHILRASIDALATRDRELLSTLSLLAEAVDFPFIAAVNPHLPPGPTEVPMPAKPEESLIWKHFPNHIKSQAQSDYDRKLKKRRAYEVDLYAYQNSQEVLSAQRQLSASLSELKKRGLLHYDFNLKRYDLHPIVRGIACGSLGMAEISRYGQRIVDYCSRQSHKPYNEAESIKDLRHAIHLIRTYFHMRCPRQACAIYREINDALLFRLGAHSEILSLLQPVFPQGWGVLPEGLSDSDASYLANGAANALIHLGDIEGAQIGFGAALTADLRGLDCANIRVQLSNITNTIPRISDKLRIQELELELAESGRIEEDLFRARLDLLLHHGLMGHWLEANTLWKKLHPMGRVWRFGVYRAGEAEFAFSLIQYWQGELKEDCLLEAERCAKADKITGRMTLRHLSRLRGEWHLNRKEWEQAEKSLYTSVNMARELGLLDAEAEAQYTLAKFHLGQLPDAAAEATRLAGGKFIAHQPLAELWLALGDREKATAAALRAYESAWADGEPYVYRYALNQATAVLTRLGVPIPTLPAYDPSKNQTFPWEPELRALIDKKKAENAEKVKKAAEAEQAKNAAKAVECPPPEPPPAARPKKKRAKG